MTVKYYVYVKEYDEDKYGNSWQITGKQDDIRKISDYNCIKSIINAFMATMRVT